MIYEYVDVNPFEEGMEFESFAEALRFAGQEKRISDSNNDKKLSHFCEWHKDGKIVCIDKVFDEVIPFKVKGFRFDVGDIITTNTGQYKIIDRFFKPETAHTDRTGAMYKCQCLKDGYIFTLPEKKLVFRDVGCPVCGGRKFIPGIRTLNEIHPEVVKYFANPEEAKLLRPSSKKIVECRCPDCKTLKKVNLQSLIQHGLKCEACSDGFSYPNKFVREFLRQLNIDFDPEKQFDWSEKRFYDQYVPSYNMIIENHGLQHYEQTHATHFRSFEKEHQIDILKQELAINNGIAYYIVIDCRESTVDWIHNSIMNSELPKIFNFKESDIDWNACDLYAVNNSEIKRTCDCYNNMETKSLRDIAKLVNHTEQTVRNYLDIGTRLGYCDFERNNSEKNGLKDTWQGLAKPIYCVEDDIYFMYRNYVKDYYEKQGIKPFDAMKLYQYTDGKKYKGKTFQFIPKPLYNEMYDKSLTDPSIHVVGERYLDKYAI